MRNTPTTELEAVNIMLSAIGEAPVNNLETAGTYDLAFAKNILSEVDRQVQSFGWRFNTDLDVDLVRDGSNRINMPPNALKFRLQQRSDVDPVLRGTVLYDRKNKTYTFSVNLKAEKIVYRLPFEQLPETARAYIAARAVRRFQDRVQGDNAAHMYTKEDEIEARSVLRKDQADEVHLSFLDSLDSQRVVNRRISIWPLGLG